MPARAHTPRAPHAATRRRRGFCCVRLAVELGETKAQRDAAIKRAEDAEARAARKWQRILDP